MPITTGCIRPGVHAYPEELASFIFEQWPEPLFQERLRAAGIDPSVQLPDRAVFENEFEIVVVGVIHGAVRSSTWVGSAADHERESARLNELLCEKSSGARFASIGRIGGFTGRCTTHVIPA